MADSTTLAIVSVSVSGVVGLAGLGVGLFTSWRDRSGAVTLAREERQQGRLADAYLTLLEFTEKVGAWAQMVLPVVDSNPPAPDPPTPDLDAELAVRARIALYGSDSVQAAVKAWEQSLRDLRARVLLVRFRQAQAKQPVLPSHRTSDRDLTDWTTPWSEIEKTFRPAELAARLALQQLVAHELRQPEAGGAQ